MTKIDFSTPVKFANQFVSNADKSVQRIDEYFYLGGKVACVLPGKTYKNGKTDIPVMIVRDRTNCLLTALKIISYFTVIIPLIMLIAKAIARHPYHFHTIDPHNPPGGASGAALPLNSLLQQMIQHQFSTYPDIRLGVPNDNSFPLADEWEVPEPVIPEDTQELPNDNSFPLVDEFELPTSVFPEDTQQVPNDNSFPLVDEWEEVPTSVFPEDTQQLPSNNSNSFPIGGGHVHLGQGHHENELPTSVIPNQLKVIAPQEKPQVTVKKEEVDPVGPTSSDPAVSNLLKKCQVGDNAKRYSALMEQVYSSIPAPDDLELYGISENLDILLKKHCPLEDPHGSEAAQKQARDAKRNEITQYFLELSEKQNRTVWEDRFLKMVIAIHKAIKQSGDESLSELLAMGLVSAFSHCSNRKSTEIERLYFTYVAPELMENVQALATPQESLIFEMMQNRMKIRDAIINRLCNDEHNAASHRYFRAKLNKTVFYLPTPILCAEDNNFAGYAMQDREGAIIKAFRQEYESPSAIYDIFNGVLYPNAKNGETFKFKRDMFVQWLNDNGLMNADAFVDDDMFVYKPEIVIRYLKAMGFLK